MTLARSTESHRARLPGPRPQAAHDGFSLPRSGEVPQVRRRLVLFGGHEQTVPAQEIDLIADGNVNIVFRAHGLLPPDRLFGWGAAIVFGDRPRASERMIERGDFVVQDV